MSPYLCHLTYVTTDSKSSGVSTIIKAAEGNEVNHDDLTNIWTTDIFLSVTLTKSFKEIKFQYAISKSIIFYPLALSAVIVDAKLTLALAISQRTILLGS